MKKFRFITTLLTILLVISTVITPFASELALETQDGSWLGGCTDILVGKDATIDGSVINSYSCDGAVFNKLVVIPGSTYEEGTTIPINVQEYPNSYEEYIENIDEETYLGEIPQVSETYRYICQLVYYNGQYNGGINEHGVSIGETTIGGNKILNNPNGWMWGYSNYGNTSLMALGLQRAKTAREAVKIIGSLAEEYGYAQTGEHLTISDKKEVWAMEIFGAGEDWTHESGEPGAVWAAQRVPDGEIGLSANKSRIGRIYAVVKNGNNNMNSSNTFTLAKDLGLWTEGTPFVWFDVYGNREDSISAREWAVVNKFAPSLETKIGDPILFSFEPDKKVSVEDVMDVYRDYFKGDPKLDITLNNVFKLEDGEISPLAAPYGPTPYTIY